MATYRIYRKPTGERVIVVSVGAPGMGGKRFTATAKNREELAEKFTLLGKAVKNWRRLFEPTEGGAGEEGVTR